MLATKSLRLERHVDALVIVNEVRIVFSHQKSN